MQTNVGRTKTQIELVIDLSLPFLFVLFFHTTIMYTETSFRGEGAYTHPWFARLSPSQQQERPEDAGGGQPLHSPLAVVPDFLWTNLSGTWKV